MKATGKFQMLRGRTQVSAGLIAASTAPPPEIAPPSTSAAPPTPPVVLPSEGDLIPFVDIAALTDGDRTDLYAALDAAGLALVHTTHGFYSVVADPFLTTLESPSTPST